MSATVLLSGRLHRDPQAKTSGKGNEYTMATLRVGQGDDAQWWRVFAFSTEPRAELLALGDDDSVAVSGAFKVEIYAGTGEPRISLSVTADRLISAKRQKREQKPKSKQDKSQPTSSRSSDDRGRQFDDEVGFDGVSVPLAAQGGRGDDRGRRRLQRHAAWHDRRALLVPRPI